MMDDNENEKPFSVSGKCSSLLDTFREKYPEYRKKFDHADERPGLFNLPIELNRMALDELSPFVEELKNYEQFFSKLNDAQFTLVILYFSKIHQLFEIFDPIDVSMENKSLVQRSAAIYPHIVRECTFAKEASRNLLQSLINAKQTEEINLKANTVLQAVGWAPDSGMGNHFYDLAHPKFKKIPIISLWIFLIFILSIGLYCISIYFDKIYFNNHLQFLNNQLDNDLKCSDFSIEKIICIEKYMQNIISENLYTYSYVVSRALATAALLIPLLFCIKNFNVTRHNQIIYGHIAAVFRASIIAEEKYSGDKKYFMEKKTDFLFKHIDTGMGKSTDSGMPYDKVIDLLTKTVGKSKEGG